MFLFAFLTKIWCKRFVLCVKIVNISTKFGNTVLTVMHQEIRNFNEVEKICDVEVGQVV